MRPTQSHSRLPGLDLLRGLAILLVLGWHYPHDGQSQAWDWATRYGWTGVDLFFVLSGFLIGQQVLAPISRGEPLEVRAFYLRRAFRILPSYLLVLAVYFCLPSLQERPLEVPLWRFLTFTQNFNLRFSGFSHAWSLCVEEQFYLVLPWVALLVSRRRSSSITLGALTGLLVLAPLLRWGLWTHVVSVGDPDGYARRYVAHLYYPTYSHDEALVLGVGLAVVRTLRPSLWGRWSGRPWLWGAVALGGLGGAVLLGERFDHTALSAVLQFQAVAWGFAALVLLACTPWSARAFGGVPGLETFAVLSFPIYLTHKMVFHLILAWMAAHGRGPFAWQTLAVVAPAVVTVGWLLHRAVERPMLRLRARVLGGGARPEHTRVPAAAQAARADLPPGGGALEEAPPSERRVGSW